MKVRTPMLNEVKRIVHADPALWASEEEFVAHAIRDAILRARAGAPR